MPWLLLMLVYRIGVRLRQSMPAGHNLSQLLRERSGALLAGDDATEEFEEPGRAAEHAAG